MPTQGGPADNLLLGALPSDDLARLTPLLERVPLRLGDSLYEPGRQLEHAYFPVTAIISLHYVTRTGASSEVAAVGPEGVVGFPLLLGGESTPSCALVRSGGHAYRLGRRQLAAEFRGSMPVQRLLLLHLQSLIVQMCQTAACNRHHAIEQQLSRWLLWTLDRLPEQELTMTQELVGSLLGVRRESITEAAGRLQGLGFIRYRRGHIEVVSREGLQTRACECYLVVKNEMRRLLPARILRAGAMVR
jgi:CRP-like cAMP-binding protein